MPKPSNKPITDHHKHRAEAADEASHSIDNAIHHVMIIVDSLRKTNNEPAANEWKSLATSLQDILEDVRRIAR